MGPVDNPVIKQQRPVQQDIHHLWRLYRPYAQLFMVQPDTEQFGPGQQVFSLGSGCGSADNTTHGGKNTQGGTTGSHIYTGCQGCAAERPGQDQLPAGQAEKAPGFFRENILVEDGMGGELGGKNIVLEQAANPLIGRPFPLADKLVELLPQFSANLFFILACRR